MLNEKANIYELLNAIPGNMLVVNRKGNILFANNNAIQALGYKDFPNITEILSSTIDKGILRYIEHCLTENTEVQNFETFTKTFDAAFFPSKIFIKPIKTQNNESKAVVISITNISIQKLEEERLELQRFSVEQATDSLFWVDKNMQIIYANETASRILGYSNLELSLLSLNKLTENIELDQWHEMWEVAKNCGSCIFETQFYTATGMSFPAEMVINYVSLKDGNYMCSFVRDISHLKLEQKRFQQYTAELERKNRELEQLTYITSHNLQEPLRMIGSFSQLLKMRYKDQLDVEANDFINFITEGTKRMRDLLADVSIYSNINRSICNMKEVDVQVALKNALHTLHSKIEACDATINIGKFPKINMNEHDIEQLFHHLISNSIKYRQKDKKSTISVSVELKENNWIFAVKDNGIGIEAAYSEKIFRVFSRLHTYNNYKGTGIGLAICQKIVEKYAGKIWLGPPQTEGCTFYFSLPIGSK
ncbi:MAG: ATP-binding protein [Chitinophagales bacterium]